tara:strand:+ start:641 stop:1489 length:849 start_codon:yes stop_codon:yes gene_type:complete
MIGFNYLGRKGRIGNQIFQYATLRGIAEKHGYDWCVPPQGSSSVDDYGTDCNYLMFETFKLGSVKNTGFVEGDTISESGFDFDKKLFDTCPDNVNLSGHFQTEKYFKHIEKSIREDFIFHDDILNPCKEFIESIGSERVAFLHVRRGHPKLKDAYTNLTDCHPPCSIEYYKEAVSRLPDNIPILVFSDYIEWCKEQSFFDDDRFMLSESYEEFSNGIRSHFSDLCLMTLCTDAIIANSSFSWWGAWLIDNPDKKVIAPKKWFGPKYSDFVMSDLIPDGWIEV